MNESQSVDNDQLLEPPGSVVVVGAGLLGIEAALYGRFLGYDVTLIEAESVGYSVQAIRDQPIPMLPDRCLSPLALSAINAQDPEGPPFVLPTTVDQWIDTVMIPLTQTDLLRGRLRCPARVIKIDWLPIEPDDEDTPDAELPPPDFRLTIDGQDPVECEAVIVATGDAPVIPTGFSVPCPYFFRLGVDPASDPEQNLLLGLKQIVDVYAKLADRKTLDLYRPVRGSVETQTGRSSTD